jgi:hypothetical protein
MSQLRIAWRTLFKSLPEMLLKRDTDPRRAHAFPIWALQASSIKKLQRSWPLPFERTVQRCNQLGHVRGRCIMDK